MNTQTLSVHLMISWSSDLYVEHNMVTILNLLGDHQTIYDGRAYTYIIKMKEVLEQKNG